MSTLLSFLLVPRAQAVRWGVALGVLAPGGAVAGVLGATGIGGPVAPFVTFYTTVSACYLYGGAVGVIEPTAEESDDPVVRPSLGRRNGERTRLLRELSLKTRFRGYEPSITGR